MLSIEILLIATFHCFYYILRFPLFHNVVMIVFPSKTQLDKKGLIEKGRYLKCICR